MTLEPGDCDHVFRRDPDDRDIVHDHECVKCGMRIYLLHRAPNGTETWEGTAGKGPAAHANEPTTAELAALERLVKIGHGLSGQCVRVRSFLLAWWNAHENGGFDLWDACNVDDEIAADMATVFVMIARIRSYPDGNPRLPDLRADMEAFIARAGLDEKRAVTIREDCQRFELHLDDEISALVFHLEKAARG